MKKLNQRGAMDVLLIPLIVVTTLFLLAGSFGIWAYMSRQDYKNNTDQKVEDAVAAAIKTTEAKKDTEFTEKEKLPLQDYRAPATFGGVDIKYPKTWSAYVVEQSTGSVGTPIDAYFHPVFVPNVNGKTDYALRAQVSSGSYTQEIKKFDPYIKQGKIKVTPYIPAKVQTVTGLRLDGEIFPNHQGSMVIMPMRDKTLKIWTEGSGYVNDFNNNILPNYSFEP